MTKLSGANRPPNNDRPITPTHDSDDSQSFLLRLWRNSPAPDTASDAGKPTWRASLQSVKTGERHMFADLETLLTFLVDQTAR